MGKLIIKVKAAGKEPGKDIKKEVQQMLSKYGSIYKVEEVPIGFGIVAYDITLIANGDLDTDQMEEEISTCQVADLTIEEVSLLPEL